VEEFAYKGWVPNITGRLCFRVIGEALSPTRSVFVNKSDEIDRYVIAYQKRDLNNATLRLPGPLATFSSRTGKFRFVMVGENSDSEVIPDAPLTGTIFVFFSSRLWKRTPEKPISAETHVRMAQRRLTQFDPEYPARTLRNVFGAVHAALIAELMTCASCYAEFRLDRSGEFSLSELKERRSMGGSSFPDLPREHKRIAHALANEIYFFAKDVSHKHQHHPARSDTMLPLSDYDGSPRWAVNTLRALRFRIIEGFRTSTEGGYNAALGFLAYKRTFSDVVRTQLCLPRVANLDNDVHTELSIKARLEAMRIESHERKAQRQFLAGTFVSVVAALFAYVQVLEPKARAALVDHVQVFIQFRLPVANSIWHYLLRHPEAVIGLILSAGVCIALLTANKINAPYWILGALYATVAGIPRKVVLSIVGTLLALSVIAFIAILLR
jgi:hypothetical protein